MRTIRKRAVSVGGGSAMEYSSAKAIAPAHGRPGFKSGKTSQLQICQWSPKPVEDVPKSLPLLSPVCLPFVAFLPGLFCRLCSEHIQCLAEHIHCLQTIFIQLSSTSRLKKVNGILISKCRKTNIVGDKKIESLLEVPYE